MKYLDEMFACGLIIGLGCLLVILTQKEAVKKPQTYNSKLMIVTAYCPCEKCCGEWSDGITASGHRIAPGDKFAAAPPEIPFGTLLLIPGYSDEPVPVLDRGSAITGNKIDVYFDSHIEALNFGIKYLEITILDKELNDEKI